MATLKELNVVLTMEDNYLDKVTYVPDHAKGDMGHKDVDQGVIINFSDDKVGVLFCKSRTVQRVHLSQLVWG